jgi:large subunit ribosomal protein L32e
MNDHLTLRATSKRKKPRFIRQDAHKAKALEKNWRRPKGITNKVRLQKRGYRRQPETGWGSPVDVKYLSRDGKKMVLVTTVADVEKMNAKTDAAILAHTGAKRRLVLIATLKKRDITIININADAFEKAWQARLAAKAVLKEEKEKKKKAKSIEEKVEKKEDKKEEKKEDAEKKGEKKEEKKEEIISDDDKKKKEKEEKDKLLTKRT